MNSTTDDAGRTWHKFAMQYYHPLDDMYLTVEVWAIDLADAEERLEFIKQNGEIKGRITTTIIQKR